MALVRRSKIAPGETKIEEKLRSFPGPYIGYIKNSADVLRKFGNISWNESIKKLHSQSYGQDGVIRLTGLTEGPRRSIMITDDR